MKKFVFLWLCILAPMHLFGAIITASSTSLTDVSNAVASASHGDTVRIPAGSSTWASELYVTKAISIIGAGTNSTHITRTNGLAIWWKPSTNLPIRVSSIRFTSGYGSECIYFEGQRENPGSGRVPITSFRVDRCFFTGGKRTVYPLGWVYGVVDHNTFLNCDIAVSPQGDNTAAWNRNEGYGTTNSVVIEDNQFIVNNSAPYEPNEQIYHYEGARSTTRFNTFDFTAATSYNGLPFESHGNYGNGIVDPGTTNALYTRGQPVVEIYGNTMAVHHTYRFIYLRGGGAIIASNTMTWASGSAPSAINLTDEETWQTSFFSPLRTTWPAQDGITNSFYWANTINGSPITVSVTGPDTNVIQVNRDYWMQAPNATNGNPAGVLQSYAMLTYPHPLVAAQDGNVTAASAEYADVNWAMSLTGPNATLNIPAGGATWTNYLLVRSPMTIMGAGTNSATGTHITNDVVPFSPYTSGPFLIVLAPTNDSLVRVSNLRIFGNWTNGGGGILVDQYRSTFPGPKPPQLSAYRIDNVVFDYCYPRAFQANGRAFGVVDHCLFLDCYVGHSANGDNTASWELFTPPLWAMGTTNTKVVESSVFAYTRDLATSPVPTDAGDGVDYVFRFNTITNTQTAHYIDGLDAHGNNKMLSYEDKRGTIFVEIYNNLVNNNRGLKFAKLRGGTLMVYSNTFNVTANYGDNIQLDEEETWASYVYDPVGGTVRTNPPAQDAVTNAFFWANIKNGSALTDQPVFYDADPNYNPITFGTTNNPIAIALAENTDFWKQSPWVSGYTNRSGTIDAMTAYRPLVYPHPLVGSPTNPIVVGAAATAASAIVGRIQ